VKHCVRDAVFANIAFVDIHFFSAPLFLFLCFSRYLNSASRWALKRFQPECREDGKKAFKQPRLENLKIGPVGGQIIGINL